MKKIILIMAIILSLMFSTGSVLAYGEKIESVNIEEPLSVDYVCAKSISTNFSIKEGTAKCLAVLTIKDDSAMDYANFTVRIKNSAETVVKTFDEIKYKGNKQTISWEGSYKLSKKGTYYMQVSVKLYKGGKSIETLTGESIKSTY